MVAGLPQSASAIEPIARGAGPKFKFSLAGYSYRDLFKPNNKFAKEALTLDDFVEDCAKMGLEGTELTSYYFPKPLDKGDYLLGLRAKCFRLGLAVSGTAVGNDFCHPAGPQRTQQIQAVEEWIDVAAILGAPVIRIFSGSVKTRSDRGGSSSAGGRGDRAVLRILGQEGGLLGAREPRRPYGDSGGSA